MYHQKRKRKRIVDQPHDLGDGGKVEGWIWREGKQGNLSEAEDAEYTLDCKFNYVLNVS
jgi:hypothetical protein